MKDPTSDPKVREQPESRAGDEPGRKWGGLTCDRCGAQMLEDRCKIICRNCGNRFDCSDLNLYFD